MKHEHELIIAVLLWMMRLEYSNLQLIPAGKRGNALVLLCNIVTNDLSCCFYER